MMLSMMAKMNNKLRLPCFVQHCASVTCDVCVMVNLGSFPALPSANITYVSTNHPSMPMRTITIATHNNETHHSNGDQCIRLQSTKPATAPSWLIL